MKRLLKRTVVLLLICAGAAVYLSYFKGVDLAGLARQAIDITSTVDGIDWETLRPASVEERNEDGDVLRAGNARAYKWMDSFGQWHYTQTPPPGDARQVSSIELDPELNVIAGIEVPRPSDDEEGDSAPNPGSVPGVSPAWGVGAAKPHESLPDNPYSPDAIRKMFEDAEALKEKLNERNQVQDQVLNSQ